MATSTNSFAPDLRVKLVVASSVALTFISFWRAAAIVLNDLASSAYYAGGIAAQAIGRSAPWFILGVMLFSFSVRAVYVESCTMFTRGGVYRVVKEALGGRMAKLSVSALMFDYVLTGPISGVAAGQYIVGFLDEIAAVAVRHGMLSQHWVTYFSDANVSHVNAAAAVFAAAVTAYYWWENVKGIEESSDKALRVMQITTVMVVVLLTWAIYAAISTRAALPPLPTPANLHFAPEALGFLRGTRLAQAFGLFGILIAAGHSVLAMSGEESLAQVNRELAHPKLLNLRRAALVIAIYSTVFTGIVTFLAEMLIPKDVPLETYANDLIAELVMHLPGPHTLLLLFRGFVVVVGFLILSGAINTSIIGSNGVLSRMAEDGVLADWFRIPHKRFGTSYRTINMVAGLQLAVIVISRGNVEILGELYAFGVVWSFSSLALSMLLLRYKHRQARAWQVPLNFSVRGIQIPVGLGCITLVLFALALTNLFTKSIATISGVIFSAIFFGIFTISEHINVRKHRENARTMKEHFQLMHEERVDRESLGIRPDCVLVAVRDQNTLTHLKWVLRRVDTEDQDVVVLAARMTGAGSSEVELSHEQIFSDYEQQLFTRCVSVAEDFGKTISLVVVPARDVWSAIVQTATQLGASAVVAGLSTKMTADEQAFRVGQAWEALPEPKRRFIFQVVKPDENVEVYHVGPHTPTLSTDDVQTVHRLWLYTRRENGTDELHHSDIVSLALTRLAREWGHDKDEITRALRKTHLEGADTVRRAPAAQYFKPPTDPIPDRRERAGTSAKPPTEPH
ncbi:MAG TPA: APC family permease [Terriglobales bacterium]